MYGGLQENFYEKMKKVRKFADMLDSNWTKRFVEVGRNKDVDDLL